MDYSRLSGNHDLNLPAWGPYSKKFCGISHICDSRAGLRFDLSVFPGIYRRNVQVPSALNESGYHVWDASPDLSYSAFRHQLEWKDRVYADIAYCGRGTDGILIRCELANRTAQAQNLSLHALCSLQPPETDAAVIRLPENGIWIDAMSYTDLQPAVAHPGDGLVFDAMRPGEVRIDGCVGGSALGKRLCDAPGGTVTFRYELPAALENADLAIRYRTAAADAAQLSVNGAACSLPATDTMSISSINTGPLTAGAHTVSLTWEGGAPVILDGLAVIPAGTAGSIIITPAFPGTAPARTAGPDDCSILIDHNVNGTVYGLAWDPGHHKKISLKTDNPDALLRKLANYHPGRDYDDGGRLHYTDINREPVFLQPDETAVLWLFAAAGTAATVKEALQSFRNMDETARNALYGNAAAKRCAFPNTPAGEAYRFGQERMAATVLTNAVWPIRCKGANIRHRPPGRCWNSLYTWDSGFIGLGLAELDTEQAIENLNAYVTEPGDTETAFVHHGSAVPVQHFLYHELWNRTRSKEMLNYFYPRLQQYYRYLAGKTNHSPTGKHTSGLLQPWDLFYNSGGWDDYPPQKHVHAGKLTGSVTPVITTSMVIRCAKILARAARTLGATADATEYDADAAALTDALQHYAWDGTSGYFGYVEHDGAGRATGILRHATGMNFNMGLDGTSPLIAGACTPEQEQRILGHIESDKHLWTPVGLSTVDRSAPYYRPDGYWNGAVWMPHQWFIWKALIDLGAFETADRIAFTALELWEKETRTSYHCMEHFIVETGRGAGWHQFSGLSSPVLNWFGAYFRPARITTGYNTWITRMATGDNGRTLDADLETDGGRSTGIMITMPPETAYAITWNGTSLKARKPLPGVLQVTVPDNAGTLTIRAI